MLPKKNLKATIGKLLDVGRVQFDASFSWIFMSQVMIVVFAMVQRNAHEHMLYDFCVIAGRIFRKPSGPPGLHLCAGIMVGPNGLEPSTSSVSRKRSNQLSYGPRDTGWRPLF